MNKILKTKEINAELNYIVSNLYNFSTNSIELKKRGKELAHQITDNYLKKNDLYYVFKFKGKNLNKLKEKIILFSSFFGKTVGQNFKNEKFIEVSPDKKKIQKYKKIQDEKLRYHQTTELVNAVFWYSVHIGYDSITFIQVIHIHNLYHLHPICVVY